MSLDEPQGGERRGGQNPAPVTPPRRGPGGGGGPFGGMGMPAEKSMNFLPSAKRLLGRLRPERGLVIAVILFGVIGVVLSVLGPKILGEATNVIVEGAISASLPAGVTQEQVIQQAEAIGQPAGRHAAQHDPDPGEGIDFSQLALVLGIVLLLYVVSSVFMWLQGYILNGVTQRTVLRLRERRRGQAPPSAAELLRQAAAR